MFSTTRAPAATARLAAAPTTSRPTSSCSSRRSPAAIPSSAARSCSPTAPFAPGDTMMVFSPSSATAMNALPVGPAAVRTAVTSMPNAASRSR